MEDDHYLENHEYFSHNPNNDNGFDENNHDYEIDQIVDEIETSKVTKNNGVNTVNDNHYDIIDNNENNDRDINQIVEDIVQTDASEGIQNNGIVNIINNNSSDIIDNIGEVIENHDNIINIEETTENKEDNIELIIEKKRKKSKKKDYKKIVLSVEDQKIELETNRRKKKYLEAEFKCYNCALGFLFKDTYQTHMMRHEEVIYCYL